MGAAAATRAFVAEHREELEQSFAQTDQDNSGFVEDTELQAMVSKLVKEDPILSGCGTGDIQELAALIISEFGGKHQVRLTRIQFYKVYEEALADSSATLVFLQGMWRKLGIQRMKDAQNEWRRAAGFDQAANL
eukprot:INCI10840.1.p1 GENE.INCI10840.1~~INCI10840.1.p1  ORF type:complete len:134 (-),score=21.35 INCI10840.1:114-515(-)